MRAVWAPRVMLSSMPSASPVSAAIERSIVCVAAPVSWASFLTSAATTAKPRPASPARAASIVALSASKLVWLAMPLITLVTWATVFNASPKPSSRA